MNKEIETDILQNQRNEFIDSKLRNLVKENPNLIKDNSILEIEFNPDGSKKDIYSLASEKDIKATQIKSDLNEIEFKLSQNIITEEEYNSEKDKIENRLNEQNLVYNDLIFQIINNNDLEDIKKSISKYNLNEIDLKRLADAITSVTEEKVDEFVSNNKKFMIDKVSYWNYKYNQISKAISKSREVESFILDLIK